MMLDDRPFLEWPTFSSQRELSLEWGISSHIWALNLQNIVNDWVLGEISTEDALRKNLEVQESIGESLKRYHAYGEETPEKEFGRKEYDIARVSKIIAYISFVTIEEKPYYWPGGDDGSAVRQFMYDQCFSEHANGYLDMLYGIDL